ncbi:MAG: SDR family NAD(P)-dependent oxidoreductase [Clostridia bacterium]|nr:SDR family NAD(P)-dependent oxidoreductase [Clostridia bacterium]
MTYTLISGATGVLGGEFVRLLAQEGKNLFLTGRSEEKLKELKDKLTAEFPAVNLQICACDLSSDVSRQNLFDCAGGFVFSGLINVAGADIQKPFEEYDEQKLIFQTRACFEGAVSLTNFVLKHRAEKLQIINISSVSGLQPMPYFALYSASKCALTDFSVALNAELKRKGVTVTAIIPGAIYTRPDVKEYIKTQGSWGRIAAKSPAFVAKKSLKAAKRKKAKYIVGSANRFLYALSKLVPQSIKLKMIARRWSKTRKDAF